MRTVLVILALLTAGSAHADPAAKTAPIGTDYGPQVRAMFRVAACGGDDAVPDRFSVRTVLAHCKDMQEVYKSYKRAWADKAQAFISELRPKDLTHTVVYPFGGGDLSSALAVYPDAEELTTVSLEAAGDIRVIDTITKAQLATDLDKITMDLRRLYHAAHSTTQSLQEASHSQLPGTIMMALAGLAVHDMEPVALRYFDIEADGSLRYLTNDELDARAAEFAAGKRGDKKPKKITHYWYEQDSAFPNVEIQFRPRGDPKANLRTYRHIVANLDDVHMTKDDRVLKHLGAKGKVAVITKAATFLLWYDDFKQIRDYLLEHTAWMISDASGIPPSYAGPAGFEQITYGEFTGPYFVIDNKNTRAEFVKLWKTNPHHDLPFRFGYPDAEKHNHLMITRPKPTTPSATK
ncbi:hypothetical protein BH11MYX1_BH11MYX1_36220 [soil metagenome]